MQTMLFDQISGVQADLIVAFVPNEAELASVANKLDKDMDGAISQLRAAKIFSGKLAETLLLPAVNKDTSPAVLLVGLGKDAELTDADGRKVVAAISSALKPLPYLTVAIAGQDLVIKEHTTSEVLTLTSQWLLEGFYQFTGFKQEDQEFALETILFQGSDQAALDVGVATAKGSNYAKQLGNLPGNVCTPNYLASQAQALGENYSIGIDLVDESRMNELGMQSLLSVGRGSDQPSYLIVMTYNGGVEGDDPYVLLGKGITFDTGGISLKPGAKMDEMKYDMCGAASVFGAMTTICELKPKLNVVAVVAAAENMPSGNATKPGDIVRTMSGQTVEILNTDAEGRLVLCDALTYIERFNPKSVVDVATLTGACVVALGSVNSGMYTNNEQVRDDLLKASKVSADNVWPMPLNDEYQKQLDSNFADIANIGGPEAGSVTAACFLSRFTKSYPWAHLDIAGTAWTGGASKGASGRPVALLTQYLLNKAQ